MENLKNTGRCATGSTGARIYSIGATKGIINMTDKQISKRAYISYIDDSGNQVNGYVDLLEETALYIKFKTNKNLVTINRRNVIKVKELGYDN